MNDLTVSQLAFLAAYASCGNVTQAATSAGVGRSSHYDWMREEGYRQAFEAARDEAADLLEREARRRAVEGTRRLKFHQGAPIMVPLVDDEGRIVLGAQGEVQMVPYVEHEYSDVLMIFLLKAARPDTYRERTHLQVDAQVNAVGQVHLYLPDNGRGAAGDGG